MMKDGQGENGVESGIPFDVTKDILIHCFIAE
jgi:hypothetical protein